MRSNKGKRRAVHVLRLACIWIGFLIALFAVTATFNIVQGRQCISDAVLITLVSATSLGVVVGMVSIILRHLFAGGRR